MTTMSSTETISPPLREGPRDDGRCLGEVDKRRDLTQKEFVAEYFKPRKPVVLQGLMDDWPATLKWSDEYLREKWGHLDVPTGHCFKPEGKVKLNEYLDYMQAVERGEVDVSEIPPLYMEGWYYKKDPQDCGNIQDDYPVLPMFDVDWFEKPWFPSYFDPCAHGLLIGAKGVYTKPHYDQLGTHSWNAHIRGRKRWAVADPKYWPYCYEKEAAQTGGYLPGFDMEAPDLEKYPEMAKIHYWTSTVEPGEIMWFPMMWLHQAKSLDASVGVTHNYMTASNFRCVMGRFLGYRFGLMKR